MIVTPDLYRANLLRYTTMAYNLLTWRAGPMILDAGCGTGVPTLHLAGLSGGTVIAFDANSIALEQLALRRAELHLTHRVHIVQGVLERVPFEDGAFDCVWAEGSIARIGFSAALRLFAPLIREGGSLVIHDDADGSREKCDLVAQAGLTLTGFFQLSERVWWDAYYEHLEAAILSADGVRPPHTLAGIRSELNQFRSDPTRFCSAFFVITKHYRNH